MDTGISSARTQCGDFLGGELFQRLFQFVLDGQAGALALPALIGLTVVGDAQSDSHCRVSVLAVDLTLPGDLGEGAFESKSKLSDAMSAGIASRISEGAFTVDLTVSA